VQERPVSLRCKGSKEGSYLRLVDFCNTQLYAESNEEEEEGWMWGGEKAPRQCEV